MINKWNRQLSYYENKLNGFKIPFNQLKFYLDFSQAKIV